MSRLWITAVFAMQGLPTGKSDGDRPPTPARSGSAADDTVPVMGAWDATVFGNDEAADWAGDLVDADDEQRVRDALERAVAPDSVEYLESFEGAATLAAAEVVAAAAGRPTAANAYNENALAWAAGRSGLVELAPLAARAVERVLAENSELRELWAETDDLAWTAAAQDLLGRLR